jgi:hypothetical protein
MPGDAAPGSDCSTTRLRWFLGSRRQKRSPTELTAPGSDRDNSRLHMSTVVAPGGRHGASGNSAPITTCPRPLHADERFVIEGVHLRGAHALLAQPACCRHRGELPQPPTAAHARKVRPSRCRGRRPSDAVGRGFRSAQEADGKCRGYPGSACRSALGCPQPHRLRQPDAGPVGHRS